MTETINLESTNLQIDILEVDNKIEQNTPACLDNGTAHTSEVLQSKKMTSEFCKHTPNVRKSLKNGSLII